MRRGEFPLPTVITPSADGRTREIIGWPESVVRAWKAALPVRRARPMSDAPYPRKKKPKVKPVGRPE
jgi:hypothetical protein